VDEEVPLLGRRRAVVPLLLWYFFFACFCLDEGWTRRLASAQTSRRTGIKRFPRVGIEAVQRAYTRRIHGMSGVERPYYRTRLKALKLYSLERRRERYTVLYMWNIIRGLVPNPGITTGWNPRTGMHINLPIVGGSCYIQKLTRESVLYRGPRLFDSLSRALRQMEDVNLLGFKRKLDNWLANVLDQPIVRGLCRASPTNSIIDQVKYM
jgi:hypothetical protein